MSLGILLATGVVLGAFLFTRSEERDPDRWQASIQLLVPARDEDGGLPEGVPPSLLQGQAEIALSAETTALQSVGLDETARSDVEFGFSSNERGDILTLTVTALTPEQARDMAFGYAGAFAAARRESVASDATAGQDTARRALETLEDRLAEVDAELQDIDPELLASISATDAAALGEQEPPGPEIPRGTSLDAELLAYEHRSLVSQIESTQQNYADRAIESIVPQSFTTIVERQNPQQITPELPSPLIPIGVAVAIGLVLAVAIPVLMDRLDHTIRDPRVAARALSAPVLSTIPASLAGNRTRLAAPGSEREGAYRRLAAASIATDQLPRAIVVTSPVGHMQDSVAANFAAALAGLGLRVALVATDPGQAWYSEQTEEAFTLPDYLATASADRLNGHIRDRMMPTPIENLRVVPHGITGVDELLDGLPALLDAFADAEIDVTVIAGPPMLEESSTTILAWSTRSVLWVVEAGEVTEQEARDAAERLALAGATPFGVAVVDGIG